MKVIIPIGPSGSGKSTLIENEIENLKRQEQIRKQTCSVGSIIQMGFKTAVVSADHFFIDLNGNYIFDSSKLGQAHGLCLRKFVEWISYAYGPDGIHLFVDNTNCRDVDIAPYINLALAYGCELDIVVLHTNINDCIGKNIHNVSKKTILHQLRNMEHMLKFWPHNWPAVRHIYRDSMPQLEIVINDNVAMW